MPINRFGATEICAECGRPYADSNYVATTADAESWCGDCWDAALGVTLVVTPQSPGMHICACGHDLCTGSWFAVEQTEEQAPHCQSCCLDYWGLRCSDMTVTVITTE